MLNDSNRYKFRRVFISVDWFAEIQGLWADDEHELAEILKSLSRDHGWPVARIVLVNAKQEAQSAQNSIGLATYYRYVEIRVGPHDPTVSVTPWSEGVLT